MYVCPSVSPSIPPSLVTPLSRVFVGVHLLRSLVVYCPSPSSLCSLTPCDCGLIGSTFFPPLFLSFSLSSSHFLTCLDKVTHSATLSIALKGQDLDRGNEREEDGKK